VQVFAYFMGQEFAIYREVLSSTRTSHPEKIA